MTDDPADFSNWGLKRATPPAPARKPTLRERIPGQLNKIVAAVIVVAAGFGVFHVLVNPPPHRDLLVEVQADDVRGTNGEISTDILVPTTYLQSGDCVTSRLQEHADRQVQAVPCSEGHYGEVFAVTSMPVTHFPGTGRASALARQACADAFTGYVGVPEGSSSLVAYDYYPGSAAQYLDDPAVRCVVESSTKVTGTLRDSRR